jgi:hypothetical protein
MYNTFAETARKTAFIAAMPGYFEHLPFSGFRILLGFNKSMLNYE